MTSRISRVFNRKISTVKCSSSAIICLSLDKSEEGPNSWGKRKTLHFNLGVCARRIECGNVKRILSKDEQGSAARGVSPFRLRFNGRNYSTLGSAPTRRCEHRGSKVFQTAFHRSASRKHIKRRNRFKGGRIFGLSIGQSPKTTRHIA